MSEPSTQSGIAKRLAFAGVVYVFLLLGSALYWFPPAPQSRLGWVMFLLFAPPLYLFGEGLGDRLTRPWWESSLLGKAIKAILLVTGILIFTIVVGALGRL